MINMEDININLIFKEIKNTPEWNELSESKQEMAKDILKNMVQHNEESSPESF